METLEIVLTLSLLSLSLIGFLFRRKISHPLTKWPLFGHLGPFIFCRRSGVNDYLTYLLEQCCYTAQLKGLSFTKQALIVTSDPGNINHILNSNASTFTKGSNFKEIFEVWGDGILAADSDSWRFQRRLIHSLFKHADFLELVENTAHHKLEFGLFPILDHAAEHGNVVDLRDLTQRYTIDLTCKFLLGTDLNSLSIDLPDIPFSKAFDEVKQVMFLRHIVPMSLWRLQKWMKIGLEGKAIKAKETINEFIYQQISFKRQKIRKDQSHKDTDFDMISRFMKVEEEALSQTPDHIKMPISDMFLRDSVVNILSAGRDPSSATLTWFFWLISKHSSVEKKIKEEIKETLGLKESEKWKFPSFQKINKLVYLTASIYETLRLYPSIPLNRKTSVKPDILPSGHKVDKDLEIIISPYTQGRMESIWGADCLEYKPERWISEKGEIIHVGSSKFTAFSAGLRSCLGKDLVMMELKLAISAVIWDYKFEVVKGHSVAPAKSIVLYPKHGLKVHVTKNHA